MNFETFVEDTRNALQIRMGNRYKLTVTKVTKNNNVQLTGIVVSKENNNVAPTIYLNSFYEEFLDDKSVEQIVGEILEVYEQQVKEMDIDMQFFTNYEIVKNRIYCKLVHFAKNKVMLEEVPHFRWNDLAVVFYYAMEVETLGKASILIRKEHAEHWKKTTSALYEQAMYNVKTCLKEQLIPMKDVLKEIAGVQIDDSVDIPMYILTNCEKAYGANVMLYSKKMEELSECLQSDLLILPSSVHEVLLLPDEGIEDYDFYRQMVQEVNDTHVAPEEILSYSIYRYNRKKKTIEEIIS